MTGEWAVSTDTKYVRMCFAPGVVIRMATYEAFEQDMKEIQTILAACQDIQTAVDAMAKLAEKHRDDAEYSSKLAESWAHGNTGVRAEEERNNSEFYSKQAEKEADRAKEEANRATAAANIDLATQSIPGLVKPDGITTLVTNNGELQTKFKIYTSVLDLGLPDSGENIWTCLDIAKAMADYSRISIDPSNKLIDIPAEEGMLSIERITEYRAYAFFYTSSQNDKLSAPQIYVKYLCILENVSSDWCQAYTTANPPPTTEISHSRFAINIADTIIISADTEITLRMNKIIENAEPNNFVTNADGTITINKDGIYLVSGKVHGYINPIVLAKTSLSASGITYAAVSSNPTNKSVQFRDCITGVFVAKSVPLRLTLKTRLENGSGGIYSNNTTPYTEIDITRIK